MNGGMQCWGLNDMGQLGDNSNVNKNTPVNVSGLSNAIAISAGYRHTCALTTTGGVKCWGNNTYGQLGNSSNTSSNIPVDVNGLTSGAIAITLKMSSITTIIARRVSDGKSDQERTSD
jgi:alpha-tubulin suppressor-like RCC1 family protein